MILNPNTKGKGPTNVLLYTEQQLIEEEKNQVKKNLGLYYTKKEVVFEVNKSDFVISDQSYNRNCIVHLPIVDWYDEGIDWVITCQQQDGNTLILNKENYLLEKIEYFFVSSTAIGLSSSDMNFAIFDGATVNGDFPNPYVSITELDGTEIIIDNEYFYQVYTDFNIKFYSYHHNKIDKKTIKGDFVGKFGENSGEIFNNYVENKASGEYSHAEGSYTEATGNYSHAEGYSANATGEGSHAEGINTVASGVYSHAEGNGAIASGNYSHAQGKCNIEDTENKYAHIVGNGSYVQRSNAHTLDWNGNAWFSGDIYVGSTSGTNKDAGSVKLSKEGHTHDYATKPSLIKATLTASNWNSSTLTQTITVNGIVADEMAQIIHITPIYNSANIEEIGNCGIYASAQGTNSITFSCESVPTSNVEYYIEWYSANPITA